MPAPDCASLRVVAIGASAGGLLALRQLVAALPRDFAAAVLVVLHLYPTVPSRLPWLLARHAALPVRSATDGETITGGRIYVAVPDRHLLTDERRVRLVLSSPVHHVRPSVDRLFASMAAAYGARCAGVVLSGTGVDGAEGLVAVRRAGGTTIAQDPAEAQFRGMPTAAIATGCVDHVLDLASITSLLVRLAAAPAGASA
jgi:two-component system, chemotaxis family, protein-glutamate methylesterase/glutaminase